MALSLSLSVSGSSIEGRDANRPPSGQRFVGTADGRYVTFGGRRLVVSQLAGASK